MVSSQISKLTQLLSSPLIKLKTITSNESCDNYEVLIVPILTYILFILMKHLFKKGYSNIKKRQLSDTI